MNNDFINLDKDCMDWNDPITDDGKKFIVLPEGDYNFEVTNFERGHFPGGTKLPACNKATVTLRIENDKGIASARADIFLHRSVEWKISDFFRAIGAKKNGETIHMDWNNVIGKKGRAHFKPRTYLDKSQQEHQINDLDYFYDYDEKYFGGVDVNNKINDDDDLPF